MLIGLAFDLKDDFQPGRDSPEDAFEEYDSPAVVNAIARSLRRLGHRTVLLGGGRKFISKVLKSKVDFVFNISEGRGSLRSREAQVPSILEMLDIPYTGSDPLTLALTLDKPLAKQLVAAAGVATPPWLLVGSAESLEAVSAADIPLPAFIKPAFEGSSKGIRLTSRAGTAARVKAITRRLLAAYKQPVLIEKYIEGDEVTVGMVGNGPPAIVGIMRVLPRSKSRGFVYSLEVKRDWRNLVDYECPAKLPKKVMKRISEASLAAFKTLGCRDFARADFRVAPDGTPCFLEVNPLPGLNPESGDLPIMSGRMGWTYDGLIRSVFESALARYR